MALKAGITGTTTHHNSTTRAHFKLQEEILRAASHELCWLSWPGFPRSRLTSKSFIKFSMWSYETAGWLSSRDLRFSNRDLASVSVLKFFGHMNTSARLPGWKRDEFYRPGRHLPIACCIFHTISIPFNCSDTAIRVAIAMKDANSR